LFQKNSFDVYVQ